MAMLAVDIRTSLHSQVRDYRSQFVDIRNKFRDLERNFAGLKSRETLMGARLDSVLCKQGENPNNALLEQKNQKLEVGISVAHEVEQIAKDTANMLAVQKNQIYSSLDAVRKR